MNAWKLPTSLTVGGEEYAIRSDYRDVLTILRAFNDPDLPPWAQELVMLKILFEDFEAIPKEHMQEAAEKAVGFINNGTESDDNRPQPKLMDWEQDAELIIPAINRVAGQGDVRSIPYLHWWTFLGYYMEIGESLFSNVIHIRQKRAKGKKLEKWEREFEKDNMRLIRLKKPLSEEEQEIRKAEEAALRELIG